MEKEIKTLSVEEFAELMLASLANKDKSNSEIKKAELPSNYKQIIQNIMCACNGWSEKFREFIDANEYFYDNFYWEFTLVNAIELFLIKLNKKYTYDFKTERIIIEFTDEEIKTILKKYPEDMCENMDHFTNLLIDYIYTREYQEKFIDYSAAAIKTMKMIKKEGYDESKEDLFSDTFKNNTEINEPSININGIIKAADIFIKKRCRTKK